MEPMLSAKGNDITSWRAAANFAAAYRQALLDRAASDRSGSSETVFSEAGDVLEASIASHREFLKHLEGLIDEVAAAPAERLKELTIDFYNHLYRHFGRFRSAPAFYQLSMTYLCRASAAVIARTTDQLGPSSRHLPEMTLIAVGPAGRGEYSPFCPLQILLVHGDAEASQFQTIELFCRTLHTAFANAGLSVDPQVTPRNAHWRGTLPQWHQRCEERLQIQTNEDLIDLYRLVDQYTLYSTEGFAPQFKQMSSAALSGNRPALTNLISRMTLLKNGLNLMGRLKLERIGSERGMFRLLDYGLLPLSAALSALALIKKSTAVGNCERIRDLLGRRELDVELAERMLAAWHSLNNLRLLQEQSFHIDVQSSQPLLLNANEFTADQRQALKTTLESVAFIQRHVEIIFSGTGE